MHQKYAARGVVFYGIPADAELPLVRDAIARWQIPWDQLFDARGYEAPLWTQFNVEEQPAFYVFDAEGKIAAKKPTIKDLPDVLERLSRK